MNILFFFIITQLYNYNSYDFIEYTEQVLRTKPNINLLSIKPLNYFYDTHQYLGYNFSTAFRTYLDNDVFFSPAGFPIYGEEFTYEYRRCSKGRG